MRQLSFIIQCSLPQNKIVLQLLFKASKREKKNYATF